MRFDKHAYGKIQWLDFWSVFFWLDMIFEGVGYDKLFVFNFALYLFFKILFVNFFFKNKIILFFQTM